MDDLNKHGRADRDRINVHEEHEVRYWTHALGVSEERLRQLVDQAGVMAVDVRRLLEES